MKISKQYTIRKRFFTLSDFSQNNYSFYRKTTNIRDNKLQIPIQKCTHPNGNHSTKQSCPKTGKLFDCVLINSIKYP